MIVPFGKETRLDSVRAIISARKLDAILISDSIDAEYVSGFHSSNMLLVVTPKKALIISDSRYETAGREFCIGNPDWKFVKSSGGLFAEAAKRLTDANRLGINFQNIMLARFKGVKELFPKRKFVDIGENLSAIFAVKSVGEIASIRRAAEIAESALSTIASVMDTDWTEEKTAAELEICCRENGSQGPSFPTIVLFGERSALPHGVPGSRNLSSGDFVLVDFGCMVNGFCSDMTRTFVFGKSSKRQKEIHRIVLEAHDLALEKVAAGVPCSSVDKAARKHIEAAGYGSNFGHGTGHGVGRLIHEVPRVGRKIKNHPDQILESGMVVTVEPGIYIEGFGGVRIEDMVAVNDDGCTLLTSFPRGLDI